MSKSVYSFGEESPLKFQISDKLAKNYNEAIEHFFKAQQRFNQKFGRRWNPKTDPIEMRWARKHRQAWDEFAKVMKKALDEHGGPVHENDIMDDFLIKNTSVVVSKTSNIWGQALPLAVYGGVLYVLLRGLNRQLRSLN
jgi:hypothetical protein